MSADESHLDVGAVVMAGGAGTRLGAMGRATPKCLLPLVDGETLLSRLLLQLHAAGIRQIAVCCSSVDHQLICAALETCRGATGYSRDELKAVACTNCSLGPIPAMAEALEQVSGRWRLLCLGDIHFATEPFSEFVRGNAVSVDGCLLTGTDQMASDGSGSGVVVCERSLVRSIHYRSIKAIDVSTTQRRWTGAYFFREELMEDLRAHVAEYRHAPLEDWILRSIERGAVCTWMEAGNFLNVNSAEDYDFLVRTVETGF
jgi:NDP-sugar pyrophosphorylase family protein